MDFINGIKEFFSNLVNSFSQGFGNLMGGFGGGSGGGGGGSAQAPDLATNPYAAGHDYATAPQMRPAGMEQSPAPVQERSFSSIPNDPYAAQRNNGQPTMSEQFQRSASASSQQIGRQLEHAPGQIGRQLSDFPGRVIEGIGAEGARQIRGFGTNLGGTIRRMGR